VPLSTPAELSKVTPVGSAPVICTLGVGKPVVLTGKLPALLTVKTTLLGLEIAGASWTVRVKFCGGVVPAVFVAVKVSGKVPPVPGPGVPLRVPVPSLLLLNVTPSGMAPPTEIVAAG
jgi:hypothetical protein